MKLSCPECGSKEVTLTHEQMFMANTLEHYCHSIKIQDDDSKAYCIFCQWEGLHRDLDGFGERND
jgi:hypothetical protein